MTIAVSEVGDQTQAVRVVQKQARNGNEAVAKEGRQEIRDKIDRVRAQVEVARQRLSLQLAFAGPLFVATLCAQAFVTPRLARVVNLPGEVLAADRVVLAFLIDLSAVWLVTAAVAVAVYYFVLLPPLQRALRLLSNTRARLRARSDPGRTLYLEDELVRLSGKTAHVFFDDQSREKYEKAKYWHTKALEILEQSKSSGDTAVKGKKRGLADVEDLISSVEELINREEYEQRHQRIWRNTSAVMVLLYSATLLVLLINREPWGLAGLTRSGLGVPFSVLLWGAVGSVAGILYRLYTVEKRVKLQDEVRWLIARPVVGVIMSALAFFAIRAGLVLLDVADPALLVTDPTLLEPDGNSNTAIPDIYLVVAFLAGFSDRFYLAVVNRLVGQVASQESSTAPKRHGEPRGTAAVSPATSLGE